MSAQDAIVAEPGARLRITVANGHQRMHGQFLRHLTDSLEFRWADSKGDQMQQFIPLRDIARIEISGSRSHPLLATTLRGAVIGTAFGLVAGRTMGDATCTGPTCVTENQAMITFGLGLGGLGGAIGFIRAAKGFDRWIPATVRGWRP